jgi:hypothetical protein
MVMVSARLIRRWRLSYRHDLAILRKAPNHPEIYEESEVDDFVAKIEDEVRSSPHVGN